MSQGNSGTSLTQPMCCSVLQCIAVRCSCNSDNLRHRETRTRVCRERCVAVCCSALQCVIFTSHIIGRLGQESGAANVLQFVAASCNALQCVILTSHVIGRLGQESDAADGVRRVQVVCVCTHSRSETVSWPAEAALARSFGAVSLHTYVKTFLFTYI